MRGRTNLIPILLAVSLLTGCTCLLSGCTWLSDRWPLRKKDVPVTAPVEVAPASPADESPAPANGQPAPPEAVAEADQDGSRETVFVEADAPPTTVQDSPPSPARGASPERVAAPVVLNRPVMLENVVPGLEPIGGIWVVVGPDPAPIERRPPPPAEPVAAPADLPVVSEQLPTEAQPGPADQPAIIAASPEPVAAESVEPPQAEEIEELYQPAAPHKLPAPPKIEYGKSEMVAASLIQVNDAFLTVDDILRGCRKELADLPKSLDVRAFRQRAEAVIVQEIRDQVVESLVFAEADQRITDAQTRLIDKEMTDTLRTMVAEVGGSRQKLEAVTARQGTDLDTLLADERRKLTVRMFLRGRFYPAISISRRSLWEYYDGNRSEFTTTGKVQMQVIAAPYAKFLPDGAARPSDQELAAAGERALEVIAQAAAAVKAGEDFGDVARRLSRGIKASSGGLWPMMPAGSFRVKVVEDAAFALEAGQVSDIIQTDNGCYIVKARDVRLGRTLSFEQAQEQIEQKLRDSQMRKLEQDYFKRLIEASHIEESDEFMSMAVDRAVRIHRR